jgi:DNA topoisomerase IA
MSKIDKDAKILVIVESPNKCSHVSAIMKELGYKHAMVAATVGHLTEIKNVRGSYKKHWHLPRQGLSGHLCDSRRQAEGRG